MAQNITLLGASYSDVPAVTLPKTGGGTASFTDVTDTTAAAADVAAGKYFYTASGVRTLGTGSGGGGTGGITQDQDGYLVLSPDGDLPTLITKTITQNGTYDAEDDNADGYSSVTVNVSGGGGTSWELLDTREVQVATASSTAGEVVQIVVPYDDQKILWVAIRDLAGYRASYFYGSDTLFIAGGAYALCRCVSGATAEKGFWQAGSGDMYGGVYARGGLTVNASTGMTTVYIRRKFNSTYCGTIDGTFKINIYALSYPSGVLPLLESLT